MDGLVRSIQERYLNTLEKLGEAARRAGRPADSVKLVVVTKSQPLEIVEAVIEAGARVLGENYPEEGATKIQSLHGFSGVEWHMIGHVQSRKAQIVARNFNFLHSLDSVKLASRLNRFCGEAGRTLPSLLEFNVGGEESKSGWSVSDESTWPELLKDIAAILELPHLRICGLMTMPPLGSSAELSRPYFTKIRRLQEYLLQQFPAAIFSELSMGTSLDYEVAVEEGATLVRVGTSIVGPRKYNKEQE